MTTAFSLATAKKFWRKHWDTSTVQFSCLCVSPKVCSYLVGSQQLFLERERSSTIADLQDDEGHSGTLFIYCILCSFKWWNLQQGQFKTGYGKVVVWKKRHYCHPPGHSQHWLFGPCVDFWSECSRKAFAWLKGWSMLDATMHNLLFKLLIVTQIIAK